MTPDELVSSNWSTLEGGIIHTADVDKTTTQVNGRLVDDAVMRHSMSQQGPLQRIWSLSALGEGSGWDLRIRPAPAPASAASGNLGTSQSGNLEIWGPGNPEIWGPTNQKNKNSQNSNPFCPKCWQGLD